MIDSALSDFVTLFVTVDPIGTVPVFLVVTGGLAPNDGRRVASRAVLVAGFVLVLFVCIGQILLQRLHIEMPSFQIAGGLILFFVAMSMLFGFSHGSSSTPHTPEHNPAIFPLAMPFIAGPGAILAAVVLTDNDRHNISEQSVTVVVLILVLAVQWIVLRLATPIQRWIGHGGTSVLSRVMGLILAAMSVETVVNGIRDLVHHA